MVYNITFIMILVNILFPRVNIIIIYNTYYIIYGILRVLSLFRIFTFLIVISVCVNIILS